jgi:hypothetical protein
MSHDLEVELTRSCAVKELADAVGELWQVLTGGAAPDRVLISQVKDGVVGPPDPTTIGHRTALYYVGTDRLGLLIRLGTYQEVTEDWVEVDGPALHAVAQVPYGSPGAAHLFAVAVAIAVARLNSGRISDIGGHWGGSHSHVSGDEFLQRFSRSDQPGRWRAQTLQQYAQK